ncbi:major capsid protein [Comamonas testosteroni]|uniref:major capsid protein n=1 Tax=Comamonas testosteroni TaxID=285 RepID=UPI0006B8CF3B|nr:major capsid protein [Comamonas testosteroni]
MQNPFENPGFSMASLTAAINLLPNRYGRLEQLNLFPTKPVRTRQIIVEEYAGRLNLLPTRAPGSPGTVGERGQRKLRSFVIPHIPHDDVVLPEEVQGLRAFGSETEMEAIGGVMARHLETMRNKHAITLEHLRMGALKGKILDADGSELINLFTEFQIAQQSVSFEFSLGEDKGKLKEACLELLTQMENGLSGEFSTGIHVLCSPEFFRALITHAEVKTAYQNWQQGVVLINDMRSGFNYSGVTFEEYRGQASYVKADGTLGTRRFIAAGEAHAFPLGTVDTFATYCAPADFNETVNTLGQVLYAKQEPRKFDRGTDLHTQSNPLPMCHRPGVLIKLTSA